jgi:hypothetical protein
MPEIGTSGLMSGDGKRDGATASAPGPSSTLPTNPENIDTYSNNSQRSIEA